MGRERERIERDRREFFFYTAKMYLSFPLSMAN
jgi:hypothetical protein